MTTRPIKTTCAWALPLAIVFAASSALAGVQQDPNEGSGPETRKTVTTTKSGHKATRTATTTTANGRTRTSSDSWTREGNTIKHEGETTLPNGKTMTRQSTTVRDGNTVTREATRTGPNGGQTTVTSIREWHPELNQATTTRTVTRTPSDNSARRSYRGMGTPREKAEEVREDKK